MKLVPLGDKVVIKQLEAEEKTKSGIVLPSQSKEKPQMAVVVAAGPGGMVDGNKVEMVKREIKSSTQNTAEQKLNVTAKNFSL